MNRDEIPPAIRKLLAAALTAGGIACAGTWSAPSPATGTPAPAQPAGGAPVPATTPSPAAVAPAEAYTTVEADDSLRAIADSLRADSLRADSLRPDTLRLPRRP